MSFYQRFLSLKKNIRRHGIEDSGSKSFDYFDIFWSLAKDTMLEQSKNNTRSKW